MSYHGKKPTSGKRQLGKRSRLAAVTAFTLVGAMFTPLTAAPAQAAATVGQGFTVTPSDLAFILKQIKIAEAHVANTTSATGPCGALVGNGPNQIPSPLISKGLRTVDGSCNNLQAGQETFGAADQTFPRLTTPVFKRAENSPPAFGPSRPTSYEQKKGSVFDSEPRTISNLIVDQTSTNPAAIAAAGLPVRTQGNDGVDPCTSPGTPAGCVPDNQTLFIPNVTTDVGLSPPYNSLFTLFGQFFDHGIDQTVKGGGTVFVPLKADDPLRTDGPDGIAGNGDEVPADQAFMVLTRGLNQPGRDGIRGDNPSTPDTDESADDVQDAKNTDSPWVDQSQTYSSHASHQVFLREYVNNTDGKPVSTGKLLGGPNGPTAGGMATWATTKEQAVTLLGLQLSDADVTNIPMLAVDAYGKFIPGPVRGLPQYVTDSGLVEGDTASPVAVPADVKHFDTPFLTDIAHNADPSPQDTDHNPQTLPVAPTPDADDTASADFASQPATTYDDEMLNAHFVCGDGRCNENIGLSTIHQVFHSEHDRLVGDIEDTLTNDTSARGVAALQEWKLAAGADGWNGERIFQAARFVNEMEYQHLVFEEFARKVQPAINPFEPFAFTQTELNPAVKAEFAHAVYRFGHSMLNETIDRRNEDRPGSDGVYGTSDDVLGSQNDITLLEGFLNPPEYTNGGPAGPLTSEQAAGSVIMGMSDQVGNELDEFVTETLRNNLLGLPLDLPTINIARARSEGIPRLNVLRRDLFGSTNDGQLKPYVSWVDFGENLKHPESLINFVAAYGQHPTILTDAGPDDALGTADDGPATLASRREAARVIVNPDALAGDVAPQDAAAFMNSTDSWANDGTHSITGLDNVDLWVGGLAEMTSPFGGILGSTFNYVFESQMTDLQNGDRLYYLARTPGMNLRTQLEGNSFAELTMRNTDAHSLKADAFATADCKFELKNLNGTSSGYGSFGNTVANDADSDCDETALLIRMPDGTIKYRARNSVDPSGINGQSVYNGVAGVDRISGGNDNDTFWGGDGNDVIEGGGGADVTLGGEGNDIITDFAGDDVPKGGPGNDAIDAGIGLDIIMGGEGKDFTNGGANANETFGGADDDFIILGEGIDAAFGDSGDDWEEGGDQPDLMQGDSGNLFFLDDSQKPGHDILIGQGGDDDYDMEGGDDIGVAGPGVEKVAGGSGYDWEIGLQDPQPQNADLAIPIAPLDILTVGVRDKFNEAEALSGGSLNDTLRGDDLVPSAVGGGGFIGCDVLDQEGLDRIAGLDALVPPLTTPLAQVVAGSASNDCPILSGPVWGDGNILLGGAGSDLIEGRGADDIIDGDAYLSVRLSVRTDAANPSSEVGSATGMTTQYLRDGAGNLTGPTLQEAVFAGNVDPGNIVAVREILSSPGASDVDTALFSGARSAYTITSGGNGTITVSHDAGGIDGVDTVRNVEKLQFADQTVDATVPGAPVIGTATAGNSSATVNWSAPTTNAATVTEYRIQVFNGGATPVTTITGIPATATSRVVTGLTNGTTYTFRVLAVNSAGLVSVPSAASNPVTPVAPAPVVTSRRPLNNATGVPVNSNVTATFDVNVTGVSGTTFQLRNTATSALIPAVVTYVAATRTATLNPNANLAPGVRFTATLTGGPAAIRSAADNEPLATQSWSFTTFADTTAPTVLTGAATATRPNPGATGVNRGANVVTEFSEVVTGISGTTVRLRVTATNALVTATVTSITNGAGHTVVTLNPNGSLRPLTQYTLVLTGGATAIRDLAGNPLANPTTRTFRTGP